MSHTIFESRYAVGPNEAKGLDTKGLRENFLIEKVFTADRIHFVYTHYERYMAGGALPVEGRLQLETIDELLKEPYFLARREIGISNLGGQGREEGDGAGDDVRAREA